MRGIQKPKLCCKDLSVILMGETADITECSRSTVIQVGTQALYRSYHQIPTHIPHGKLPLSITTAITIIAAHGRNSIVELGAVREESTM